MNKDNFVRKIKNFTFDSIDTVLPYVFDILSDIFANGLCVSLPIIGISV